MSDICKSEKTIKQLFVGNCWSYLHDNFHKFTETNKIKIALELCKKDLPTQLEGEVTGGSNQVVIWREIKETVAKANSQVTVERIPNGA